MHAVGVLCALFPEFARIDCLVQRDLYHVYTVDEHSLIGMRELERLRHGEYKRDRAASDRGRARASIGTRCSSSRCCSTTSAKATASEHPARGAAYVPAIARRLRLERGRDGAVGVARAAAPAHVVSRAASRHARSASGPRVRAHGRQCRQSEAALRADVRRHACRRSEGVEQLARHLAGRAVPAGARACSSKGSSWRTTPRSCGARPGTRPGVGRSVDAGAPAFESFLASMPDALLTSHARSRRSSRTSS